MKKNTGLKDSENGEPGLAVIARLYRDKLPSPVRFLGVGMIGLASDMIIFTALAEAGLHQLVARAVSLAAATFVTWRLNRALTFGASKRKQHAEAFRYAVVTAVAQSASYLTFAALVLSIAQDFPRLAILAGAAIGALFSYTGHSLFSFAPVAGNTGTRT